MNKWTLAFYKAYKYLSDETKLNEYWKVQLANDYAEWTLWGTLRVRASFFGWQDCRLLGNPYVKFIKG